MEQPLPGTPNWDWAQFEESAGISGARLSEETITGESLSMTVNMAMASRQCDGAFSAERLKSPDRSGYGRAFLHLRTSSPRGQPGRRNLYPGILLVNRRCVWRCQ